MREITTVTKVYTFEELSDKAQEKALERLWDLNVHHGWWESVYEDAKRIGFEITGFDTDRGNYLSGNFTTSAPEMAEAIVREHGGETDTLGLARKFLDETTALGNLEENGAAFDSLADEFERAIKEEYLHMLRREYEYLTSREAIIETIEANGYEFDEEGELQ